MKRPFFCILAFAIASFYCAAPILAQEATSDHDHADHDHSDHDHDHSAHDHADHSGHDHSDHSDHTSSDALVLNDAAPGPISADLFVLGTVGAFESGSSAGEFVTSEHDPLDDAVFQGFDMHVGLNLNEAVYGEVSGFGHQGESEWEANLEVAKLEIILDDNVTLTAGQFFATLGDQNPKHLHTWDFVNSNLAASRMINEAELITQGAELGFRPNGDTGMLFTIGAGRAKTHAHEEEEEEDGDGDEDHFHADEGGIEGKLMTLDLDIPVSADNDFIVSGSFAFGENGFGRKSVIYGVGARKIFNGCFEDGHCDSHRLGSGVLLLSGEFIGRQVNGSFEESGALADFTEQGISASAHYGLSDDLTLAMRYDWVSDVEIAEIASRHRLSTAATTHFGPNDRVRARVQYDYNHSDDLTSEHVAWLQFMVHLGTGHHGHAH